MPQRILHQPRIAWDTARLMAAVAVADEDLYLWFSARIGDLLGLPYRRELYGTRTRLLGSTRADARDLETGLWRVRLEDELRFHPDLAEDLYILGLDATSRLNRR
jgi:hypothetical protein